MDELENKRNEMLASATLSARQYLKNQQHEEWPQMLCDGDFGVEKAEALIMAHLLVGSYAAAHELLRQHLFSDRQVEMVIEHDYMLKQENLSDDRRLRDA